MSIPIPPLGDQTKVKSIEPSLLIQGVHGAKPKT